MNNPVYDYYSKQQSPTHGWAHLILKRLESRAIFKSSGSIEGKNLLDLGSGDGYYAQRVIQAGASQVTCVDFCDQFLKDLPSEKISINCLDLDTANLPAGNFDHIFCLGLLEFLKSPQDFLQRLMERLPPGTQVTLLYPPTGGWLSRLYRFFHRRHGIPISTFRRGEIQALMWSRGFRLISRHRPHPYAVVETYARST